MKKWINLIKKEQIDLMIINFRLIALQITLNVIMDENIEPKSISTPLFGSKGNNFCVGCAITYPYVKYTKNIYTPYETENDFLLDVKSYSKNQY